MQYLQDYEIRQLIQSLCMMNNRFMNLMLEDNIEAAQVLLRVTLKNDKIKVKRVKIQSFIQNLYGHSAQLDILAQDENGNYFNVEVQRSDEGAQAKRARYYSSILDTHFLQAGKDYEDLPDSYVIFITENDVLGEGRATYNVDRVIRESGKAFEDGSKIVYVNSKCQDDTPLGRLMQDMYCTDPAKLNYKEFAPRMEGLKNKKEETTKMRDLFEEYAQIVAKRMAKDIAAKEVNEAKEAVKEAVKEAARKAAREATLEAENKAKEAAKEAVKEAAKNAEKKATRNTLKDMACKMLKRGDSVEDVVEITSLPIESVRELQLQLQ